jgi:hypothetical protein
MGYIGNNRRKGRDVLKNIPVLTPHTTNIATNKLQVSIKE